MHVATSEDCLAPTTGVRTAGGEDLGWLATVSPALHPDRACTNAKENQFSGAVDQRTPQAPAACPLEVELGLPLGYRTDLPPFPEFHPFVQPYC